MANTWEEFPTAVGIIDGAKTQINRPDNEPQHEFYNGHSRVHCMSTQIIVDVNGNIVYVQSGFWGHTNDAAQFEFLPPVGPGLELDFPSELCLLGDNGYANNWPVLTKCKANERRPNLDAADRRMFNAAHASRRIAVEHSISYFKTYSAIANIYRQERWFMPFVADVCACLAHRHIQLSHQLRR